MNQKGNINQAKSFAYYLADPTNVNEFAKNKSTELKLYLDNFICFQQL